VILAERSLPTSGLLGRDRISLNGVIRFLAFGTGLLDSSAERARRQIRIVAASVWQPSVSSRLDGTAAMAYILFSWAYWTRMLILRKRGFT
jgi:hypothetical protein